MSCHYYVFIGPYIQVHNPIRMGVESIKTCTHKTCSKHGTYSSDSFCPKCGSVIGMVDIPCKKRKSFDIYTEFKGKEPLSEVRHDGLEIDDGYVLYTSNMQTGPGQTLSDEAVILSMTADTIKKDMDTITTFHAKEIVRLKEIFGNSSVQIKWGAIAYWS